MYNVHTKGSLVLTVPCFEKVDKAIKLKLKLTMIFHFDLSERLTQFYQQKIKVITVKYC